MLDCVDAQEECIAKNKELAQQKLDNITEEFESLASFAESVGNVSAALLTLNTTTGTTVNSGQNKQLYRDQIDANERMASYYSQEMSAYAAELANAAQIFGSNSNEYREALKTYQEMQTAFYNAKNTAAELSQELRKLDLKPIDYAIERLQEIGGELADIISLKTARGTIFGDSSSAITESDYTKQIENANDTIARLIERRKYNEELLATSGYEYNSDKYREIEKAIADDNHQIQQLLISNEELKKSIVTLRWEPFTKLQEQLENAKSDFEHLRKLVNQDGLFDDNGNGWELTEDGVANIALLGAQLNTTEEQIKSYRKALNKVEEEYRNGNRSEEDYKETSRELSETIQKLVENTLDYKSALVEMYKTQITNQNTALQEYISLRKEALSADREYYEYDKKIRNQQKDRNKIQAQINALQGTTNEYAKAQVARLKEQLANADEDLSDSRKSHRYDVLSKGYDQLSEDAQKSFQKTLDAIASSSARQELIVEQMLAKIEGDYQTAYDRIQQKIAGTGTVISNVAQKSLEVSGDTQQYINSVSQKLADVNGVWSDFSSEVTASGKTMAEALDLFITLIDTGTIKPKENWEAFKQAVSGEIDQSQFNLFCSVVSEGIATETGEWDTFREDVEAEFNQQALSDLFEYIQTEIGIKITDWDSFREAVANGEFSQEQLKKIYDYVSERTGTSITDWNTFKQTVESGDLAKTNVDDALNKVQSKINAIATSWGEVTNSMTGAGADESTLTSSDAVDTASDIDTTHINMDRTSDGKTAEQKAAELEAARNAEEESRLAALRAQTEAERQSLTDQIKYYEALQDTAWKNANTEGEASNNAWNNKLLNDRYYNKSKSLGHDTQAKKYKNIAKDYESMASVHAANVLAYQQEAAQYQSIIDQLRQQINSLPSYRSGTRRVSDDELALTHNDEIILGNGAVLRQLPQGSQVLPKMQADNIWKWSMMDPMKDMKMSASNVPSVTSSTNNVYYDSLIRIDGNVDSNMLDRIEDIARGLLQDRNFMQKQFNYNTKELKREYGKRY